MQRRERVRHQVRERAEAYRVFIEDFVLFCHVDYGNRNLTPGGCQVATPPRSYRRGIDSRASSEIVISMPSELNAAFTWKVHPLAFQQGVFHVVRET